MTTPIELTDELLHEALRVDRTPLPPDLPAVVRSVVAAEPHHRHRRGALGRWFVAVPAGLVWLLIVALLAGLLMSLAVGALRRDPIAVVPSPTASASTPAATSVASLSSGAAVAGTLGRTIDLVDGDWLNANGGLEAAGATWLANAESNEVVRVDIGSGQIVRISLSDTAAASLEIPIAWDGTTLWAGLGTQEIVAIDPVTNATGIRIPVGIVPYRMAAGEGRVWVTGYELGVVVAVDVVAAAVDIRRSDVPGAAGIAFDGERLFMAQREGTLMLLDPETLETVRERPILPRVMSIFPVGDRIYIHRNDAGPASYVPNSLDPATREVTGLSHSTLALLDGNPWIGPWEGTVVQRLDADTMRPVASVDAGIRFPGVLAAAGSIWAVGSLAEQPVMQEVVPAP